MLSAEFENWNYICYYIYTYYEQMSFQGIILAYSIFLRKSARL